MPKKLCNAAQPGTQERIAALKTGTALAAGLWLAALVSPGSAQAALSLGGPWTGPVVKAESPANTAGEAPAAPEALASHDATADLLQNGAAETVAISEPTVAVPPGPVIAKTESTPALGPLLVADNAPAVQKAQLAPEEVEHYRTIFSLQKKGEWNEADIEITKLHDKRLLGYVFAQRLLHPDRRAAYWELTDWMDRYRDYGVAERLYDLAERRRPKGANAPRQPRVMQYTVSDDGDLERLAGYRTQAPGLLGLVPVYANTTDRVEDSNLEDPDAVPRLTVSPRSRAPLNKPSDGERHKAKIEEMLKRGDAKAAWDFLNSDIVATALDPVEFDTARSRIAESFYQAGQLADAMSLASASAAGSQRIALKANWTAGLAAWRAQQYARAARHFEALVEERPSSPWSAAAAAYWAGRAELKANQPDKARVHLAAAARFPHTFYGLVAARTLGIEPQLQLSLPPLTSAHLTAITKSSAGVRAIALLQVGEEEMAELELRQIAPRNNRVLREALLTLADRAGMAGTTMRLGNLVAGPDGAAYDAALYPVPNWQPKSGFIIDPALIYAVTRQESRFEARMISPAGAVGVMQIMPETARYVRNHSTDITDVSRDVLFDPVRNIDIGQRYLADLMNMPAVGDNMFFLAAAFNAGPGNLVKWRRQFRDIKDPLLFIESVPFAETRDYFEKVLANYWIYRMRLGQDTPSLDQVAAGRWPTYDAPMGHPVLQTAAFDENAED